MDRGAWQIHGITKSETRLKMTGHSTSRGEMDTKETMMQLDKYSITDVRQMQFPNF